MTERTYERCDICDELTGRAGKGEDSLYCDECDKGPFCSECHDIHRADDRLASARVIMERYIFKVDGGMARSTETYAEMKEWLDERTKQIR